MQNNDRKSVSINHQSVSFHMHQVMTHAIRESRPWQTAEIVFQISLLCATSGAETRLIYSSVFLYHGLIGIFLTMNKIF